MADLFQATGGVKAQGNLPESWTAPASLFDTVDRNDGSVYSWNAAASLLTLPSSNLADGYLIIAAIEYHDTSNGRFNPQLKMTLDSGTGNFVGSPSGGYNRDNSEDRSYVRAFAFIDNPSASAQIGVQWKADADDSTGGTERSTIQVIPLYYSNIGIYASTDHTLMGGTTPNQVPGFTATHESDTAAIEIASNVVTVKGDNKRYLILGSQFFEGRGGRTQRWHGLRIDGTKEDAAKAYSYYRNTSNDESGDIFTHLLETATANVTIDQFCYRGDGISNGQGGADADGSDPGVGDHSLVVIELNDSAEVFAARDTNQSANHAATGPLDQDVFETTDVIDSASFTKSSANAMSAEKDMDVLLGANLSAASGNVGSGSRWTAFAEFTKGGAEVTDSFSGDYLRGNQGSIDTFGWSANLLGFIDVLDAGTFGVSITELPGTEGGGGNVYSPAGWLGMWGVNLDTLEAGSTDTNDERSAEVHGSQSANDTRSAETTGSIDTNDTRDAETHGEASVSDTRAAEVDGANPAVDVNSERAAEVDGQATVTDNRDAEVHGSDVSNSETTAEVHGSADAQNTRSSEIHGQDDVTSDRSAESHGQASTGSNRGAETDGAELATDEIAAEVHGEAFEPESRSSEVHGEARETDHVSAETTGVLSGNSDRAGEVSGVDTANDSRAAEATGIDGANDERSAEVFGTLGGGSDRDVEVHGEATDSDTRAVEVTGSIDSNAERAAETHGAIDTSETRDAEIHGIETLESTRSTEVTGSIDENSSRNAEISGISTATEERSAEVTGAIESNSERSAEVDANAMVGDDRSAEVDGIDPAISERSAEVEGQGINPYCPDDNPMTGKTSPFSDKTNPMAAKTSPFENADSTQTPYPKRNC
jgi:hypothetical protein